jgi:hypothetical protein
MERLNLIVYISKPNIDLKGEEELVKAVIWEAIDKLARFS